MDEVDLTTIKDFCSTFETIQRMKRQVRLRENTGKHISDNGLLYRIHKELSELNLKKTKKKQKTNKQTKKTTVQ